MSASEAKFDVVVVGAGIAGCVAASLYARAGLAVALLDKIEVPSDYKLLCTHFIQPMALPLLRRLELDRALEAAGALRTRAAFWTQAGWIDPPGGYASGTEELHAYNIERRVLDPLLREFAASHRNVTLLLGVEAYAPEAAPEGWRIVCRDRSGTRALHARLLVAADGRQSRVARHLGNRALEEDNERATYFAYYRGIAPPAHNRSLFMLKDGEMAFLYPLAGGRTLLSVYLRPERARAWRAGGRPIEREITDYVCQFPVTSSVAAAEIDSRVYGYSAYPNQTRAPVCNGAAFIGDAALSLDPMAGVGCGFAMYAADALVAATAPALAAGVDLAPALDDYAGRHAAFFDDHAHGIKADSLIAKSPEATLNIYRAIVADPALQREFINLTGRLVTPQRFQRAYVKSMLAGAAARVAG